MAHGITMNDTFGFSGKPGWHGLGQAFPEGTVSAVEGIKAIGMDWGETLLPVYATLPDGTRIEAKEHRAHVRLDNGELLGVVGEGYKSISNHDLAVFADSLAGDDAVAHLETAGTLFGGRRVFILLRMPQTIEVNNGDIVLPYICLSNGHGGFASFNVYPTSIRVECNNKLQMSERDLAKGARFYHTGDLGRKLAQARTIIGLAQKEMRTFEAQCKALSQQNLSLGQIREFMDLAYGMTFGSAPTEEENLKRWNEKKAKVMADWMARCEGEKQTKFGGGGTAWAAINAYTEWSDHARGGTWMANRPADSRQHSNMFGVSAVAKRKIFDTALATLL